MVRVKYYLILCKKHRTIGSNLETKLFARQMEKYLCMENTILLKYLKI